jgi:hypothetical protein
MSEHNAITKRKKLLVAGGATLNSIVLDPIRTEVSRSPMDGRPDDYTPVHMTRYTDRSKGRIWMFHAMELIVIWTP